MSRAVAVLLFLFCGASGYCAQAGSWASVMDLRAGDRLNVLEGGAKTHKGVLVAVTEEAVKLRERSGTEVSIARTDVMRVSRPAPNKRLRNALIGLAAGAGLGVGVDQSLGRYNRNETGGDGGRALSYALPMAAGALIGAFVPSDETIYRSSNPTVSKSAPKH